MKPATGIPSIPVTSTAPATATVTLMALSLPRGTAMALRAAAFWQAAWRPPLA